MKEIQAIQVNPQGSYEQEKFSVPEYEDLKLKLETLKVGIKSIPLDQQQLDVIHSKLDHLTDMAATMNKFDWKGLFIGTFMSIIIQLNVTPENASAVWSLIKTTFNNLFLP